MAKSTSQYGAAFDTVVDEVQGLGYEGDLLQRDYSFRDWFQQDIASERTVPAALFGQYPVSYQTACIAIAPSNEQKGVDLVRQYRGLGAPIFLEVDSSQVTCWRVSVDSTEEDRMEVIPTRSIRKVIRERQTEWAPQQLLRAKNIGGAVGHRQLDFFDLGLIPALEREIRDKLDPLLRESLQQTASVYKSHAGSEPNPNDIFRAAFWFLAGKVFHDRRHDGFKRFSLASDPDAILDRVGQHYSMRWSRRMLNKKSRSQLFEGIWSSVDFRNLSSDVLTDIWANTFVTPDIRRELGIHSTPRSVANFIVDKIPFEEIPESQRIVVEPFCGSAVFLLSALRRLRNLLPVDMDAKHRHLYFKKMLRGYEKDIFGVEISRLSLTLSDYPNANGWELHCEDVYQSNSFVEDLNECRVVLCNPPFEDFSKDARSSHSTARVRQPAEILGRVLSSMHPEGVLGFVLPRKFLDGRGYSDIRLNIASRFRDIEIVSLSDRAFEFAQPESVLLIATNPSRQHTRAQVTHGRVPDSDWPKFDQGQGVTSEVWNAISIESSATTLAIPELQDLWDRLSSSTTLGESCEIHRGIEWKKSTRDHIDKLRAFIPKKDFQLGVPPGTSGFYCYGDPEVAYLNMKASEQRGSAYLHPWERPKVILNAARKSRGRWRVAATVDTSGLVCYQTLTAIWPSRSEDCNVVAAILNGPVANAFIAEHEHGKHITKDVLRRVPIVSLSAKCKREIRALVEEIRANFKSEFLGYRRSPVAVWSMIARIDQIVLNAYGLPSELERKLLAWFAGHKRPLPIEIEGKEYSPSVVDGGVTIDDYMAITEQWDQLNRKRIELIRRSVGSTLPKGKLQLLRNLQRLADLRVNILAPLDTTRVDNDFAKLPKR